MIKKLIQTRDHKDHIIWMLVFSIFVSILITIILYHFIFLKKYILLYHSFTFKIFISVFTFYSIIWYIIFPGYLGWDLIISQTEVYNYTIWYSFMYWLISKFCVFAGYLHFIVLFNIILISIVVTYIIKMIHQNNILHKYLKYLLYIFLLAIF